MTAALVLLLALPLSAQQAKPFAVDLTEFCGINDLGSSTKIKDCESPDAENVLTDNGTLEKMLGMDVMISSALAGFSIRNIWPFIAANGTKYVVFHSSAAVYYSDLSASPTLLKTVDSSQEVDAIQAFSKTVFVNKSETGWSLEGTSTAAASGIPLASYIQFKDER